MIPEIDALLDALVAQAFELDEDISYVSVNARRFALIPTEEEHCDFRGWHFKRWRGVVFRLSPYNSEPPLRGCVAWNVSKRTRDLFKLKGQAKGAAA